MFNLIEDAKLVPVLRPIDSTGAAVTAEWIAMKKYKNAHFIINLGVLTSTSNQAVKLVVGNDASGTKSGDISSASVASPLTMPYYYKTSSGDTLTKVSVSSSTFNITKSSDAKYIIIPVNGDAMGTFMSTSVEYNAEYIKLSVATPGTHACLMAVDCLLTNPRYHQSTPPTAIT